MNNEPVAWGWYDLEIKKFFPHWDEDLMENKEGCIPLYTHPSEHDLGIAEAIGFDKGYKASHPVKELNDGGEPVKNATYWKRQYNLMASQNDNLKSGLYHANEQIKYLETHPVKEQEPDLYSEDGFPLWTSPQFKELTDEEIGQVWKDCMESPYMQISNPVGFAKAILRKAQENG